MAIVGGIGGNSGNQTITIINRTLDCVGPDAERAHAAPDAIATPSAERRNNHAQGIQGICTEG
jgi:hypothetical protein